ncbi:IclR family transcriptional regulator [Priestia megaterium]|uniref:IclR family transcriptional regulator n=1 Tax=Priestia megaterium TaxID=1404 RepID=UPI001482C69F|nr:IclR family transcriptional regulator [Priestia megaterium]
MSQNSKGNLLDKSLKIIQSFVDEKESWGVRELAAYLNYTVPTTHRILLQLRNQGIVEFNVEKNKYFIGTELIRIGSKIANSTNLQSIAKTFLRDLSKKYGETICLLMLKKDKKKIFWVDKVNGSKPLQYIIPIGELQPIPYGSSGKTILAFLEEDLIREIIQEERFTKEETEQIMEELNRIRKEKVHCSVSERLEGSTGVGSPIFNSFNEPIGSIILTAPTSRLTESIIKKASIDIRNAATEISTILGATL